MRGGPATRCPYLSQCHTPKAFLIGAKARRRLILGLPLELKPSHVSKVVNNVFYQLRPIFRVRSSVCSRLMSPATHDAALALSLPLSASERSSSWELPHNRRPFDDIMMATFLGWRTGFYSEDNELAADNGPDTTTFFIYPHDATVGSFGFWERRISNVPGAD